jgi:hypothetical protein
MEFLSELWMPILVSGVIVWFASALMHMVLPHHKGEWKGLPNEEAVIGALKGVAPGQYTFPHCTDMSQMKDPAFIEKMKNNPNGTITIWTGQVNMGRNLLLSFVTYVVIGVFVAYVAWHAMRGEQVASRLHGRVPAHRGGGVHGPRPWHAHTHDLVPGQRLLDVRV